MSGVGMRLLLIEALDDHFQEEDGCVCGWSYDDERESYDEHLADHLTPAITAHLRDVVLGAREDVRTRVRQHDWDDEAGTCECGANFCAEGATGDWWQHVADAALAVVVGVLGGAE